MWSFLKRYAADMGGCGRGAKTQAVSEEDDEVMVRMWKGVVCPAERIQALVPYGPAT